MINTVQVQAIPNCETTKTPVATTSKAPTGKFKLFADAAMETEDDTPVAQGTAKKAADALENPIAILLKLLNAVPDTKDQSTDDTAGKENDGKDQETVSMYCDSDLQALANGIAGILEGFGLLNYENGKVKIPDNVMQVLNTAFSGTQNTQASDAMTALAGNTLSDESARMPTNNPFIALPAEADAAIKKLVAEYQCSFANINNNGANEKTDNTQQPVLDQQPGNVQDASTAVNKIMAFLESALSQKSDDAGDASGNASANAKDLAAPQKLEKQDADTTNVTAFTANTGSKVAEPVVSVKTQSNVPQPTPKDMAENVSKIVEKITAQAIEGKQEFDVTLKPEYLGKLSIKITMDSDGLKAHLKAADAAVKSMISNELPALQEMLKEKGVHVSTIDVTYESAALDYNTQSNRQNQENGGNKNKKFNITADIASGSSTYDTMTEPDLLVKNSSIEFQA